MKKLNEKIKARVALLLKHSKRNYPIAFSELVRLLSDLERRDLLGDNVYHTLGIDTPSHEYEQTVVQSALELLDPDLMSY